MLHIKDIEDFASISEALNRAGRRDPDEPPPRQEIRQEKGAPAKPAPLDLFTRILRRR